ncbi:MAG: zf-HC2 domain-containing protein [Candidatus Aminicenantes bacterium]|nr:zf-HC2 domain-containing protein [Candidatus Aminicenantes bacterium]
MKCKKVKERLSAFMDDELDRKKTSEIEQHLAECSACNQELKLLTKTWGSLEVWEKIEPSDNFEAIFWQKIRGRELRQPLFQRLLTKVIPVPTAVIILIIGLVGGIYLCNILYPKETKVYTDESLSLVKENFLYLNNFEDFPPESLGGLYISLTSKGNNIKIEE